MSSDWCVFSSYTPAATRLPHEPIMSSSGHHHHYTIGQLDMAVAEYQSTRRLHARAAFRRVNSATAMSPEEVRRSQKPYRYGMILLCFGALINWVGLAENYTQPIRYAGVACIVCGALLICTAMCCWLHTPPRSRAVGASEEEGQGTGDPVQVISVSDLVRAEKPPEYETCVVQPPSYDDALQLSPAALLADAQRLERLTAKMMAVPSYEAVCSGSGGDAAATVVVVEAPAPQTPTQTQEPTSPVVQGTITVSRVMISSAPASINTGVGRSHSVDY